MKSYWWICVIMHTYRGEYAYKGTEVVKTATKSEAERTATIQHQDKHPLCGFFEVVDVLGPFDKKPQEA